jgi:hypothetical protein
MFGVHDPETSSGSKNDFRHPELVSGTNSHVVWIEGAETSSA